jgi:hypothetical protein
MFNDHLYFKLHQERHAELIREGEAQRLAESLVPKHPNILQTAASVVMEKSEAWWEDLKRQAGDIFTGSQHSLSNTR